jgi:hypothetical protein
MVYRRRGEYNTYCVLRPFNKLLSCRCLRLRCTHMGASVHRGNKGDTMLSSSGHGFSCRRVAGRSRRLGPLCGRYVSVIAGEPWPRRRLTVTISTPAAINADAWECRNPWNMTLGRFLSRTRFPQSRLNLSGGYGEPSGRVNTRSSGRRRAVTDHWSGLAASPIQRCFPSPHHRQKPS